MGQLPRKLPFSKKPLTLRVTISYIFDYVIIIALAIGFFILDSVEPYHQHFSLENKSLQYPYAVKERITITQAIVVSIGGPIIVIAIYTLLIDGLFSHHKPSGNSASTRRKLMGPYRLKDRLWELNCGILGLLLSQALAFVITQALKTACGKPRPDIIDRCQPRPGSADAPVYGLSNSSICTGDKKIIKDGFRSWPSGHSSSSFAGLFYLSLYLSGKLHIMDNRGEVWKMIIVLIPTLSAALVAVTRIMDARHHPFDVITGSMLGVFTAYISYRQYFPPLSEPWKKGRAYPIRSWGTAPEPPRYAERLQGSEDDGVPLRDADEERIPVPNPRQDSFRTFPNLRHPAALTPAVYGRRQRDRDGYSSSSSEDVATGFEMTTPQYGQMTRLESSETQYDPYRADTGYPSRSDLHSPAPPVEPVPAASRPLAGSKRPLDEQ